MGVATWGRKSAPATGQDRARSRRLGLAPERTKPAPAGEYAGRRVMRLVRILLVLAVLLIVTCIGLVAATWKSEIARVARPDPSRFDAETLKRGAQLAAVGNCIACHTLPGGKAFAGGLAVPTPFGTIYSTNITPDERTGI